MSAGNVSGHLLILHDLDYIDQREREARVYTIVALLTVSGGFGLLTLALFLALTRNWTRSIRSVLADARRGVGSQSAEPPTFFVNKEVTALLAEFRVERKFTQGVHVVWSPETLHQLLVEELPGAQVQIVSNREPYIHNRTEGGVELQNSSQRLVSALEPVMRPAGHVDSARQRLGRPRDGQFDDRLRVPPDNPAYTLRRI